MVFFTVYPFSSIIFENGLGTPKSKMVSWVVMYFCKNSKVCLNRLLGNVFSYIVMGVDLLETRRKYTNYMCFEGIVNRVLSFNYFATNYTNAAQI